MDKLRYFSLDLREYPDWRLQAMQELEYMIVCESCDTSVPFYLPEDIAQEIRITLWGNLHTWKKESSLKTWAKVLIRNKIRDLYKREACTQKRKDHLHIPFSSMVVDEKEGKDRYTEVGGRI